MRKKIPTLVFAGVIALLLVTIVGVGAATVIRAHPPEGTNPNLIHACVKNTNDQVTIVGPSGSCNPSNEAPLHWSIAGPPGPAGPAGGLSGVTFVFADSTIADQTFRAATAVCPGGKKATGGGWNMIGTVGVGSTLDSFLVIANSPTDGK